MLERCSDNLMPCPHTPHTARPDSSSPLRRTASCDPEAAPEPPAPVRPPRSVAVGRAHRGALCTGGCSGREQDRAERRTTWRKWRKRVSRTDRRPGWSRTAAGCTGAAGGQGPAAGSPEGPPACLKEKEVKCLSSATNFKKLKINCI